MGFSQDGEPLYLKGASFLYGEHDPIKNSIVNTVTGKPLLRLVSGMQMWDARGPTAHLD
jgi:hypothetical protein